MKNIIKFIAFILYATTIFFIPNNILILFPLGINILIMILLKSNIRKISGNLIKIFPFIIFTFICNCLLGDLIDAIWIGTKLILVCNITFIYSASTTITRYCSNS